MRHTLAALNVLLPTHSMPRPPVTCLTCLPLLQVAMPLYQFTSEHNVLEAARRLLQAGSSSFKFDLKNQKADGKPIKVQQYTFKPPQLSRLLTAATLAAHAKAAVR
jgi:hypothetical protein